MLIAKDLTKSFQGSGEIKAVDRVSLSLPQKGLVCIYGQSGSGKTTLVSLLSGLLTPTSGSITLDGTPLVRENASEKVSVLFQEHNLIEDMTGEENLALVSQDDKGISAAFDKLNLSGMEKQLVHSLSGGEKKRLSIIRSLMAKPSVMVLDEPTANLDAENAEEVFVLLKEASKTKLVIAVTHDQSRAGKFADALYKMEKGKVALEKPFSEENRVSLETPPVKKRRMPKKFFFHFGWKTIWKRPGKTIGSLFLSSFSFALATLLSALSFFHLDSSLAIAFEQSGSAFIPITSLSSKSTPSEELVKVKQTFPNFLPEISETESSTGLSVYTFPYKKGMKIQGVEISEPRFGSCVVSSFLSTLCGGKLGFDLEKGKAEFHVSQIIPSEKDDEIISWYEQAKTEFGGLATDSEFYRFSQQNSYLQDYAYVILNSEDFLTARNPERLFLPASDFLLPHDIDDRDYATKDLYYAPYVDQDISYGKAPSSKGEAVISMEYFLSRQYLFDDEPSNALGKTFFYRDMSSYPSRLPIRLDLLLSQITIVGISSNPSSSVYLLSDDFATIANEKTYSRIALFSLNNNPAELAKVLSDHSDEYTTSLSGTGPSYFLLSSKSSPLYPFLVALTVLLLLLSSLYSMMVSAENVSTRKREVALLRSLGIRNSSIRSCFLFQNGFLGIFSFLFALVLVYPSLAGMNAILKSPSVFGVPFDVLFISPWTLAVGFMSFALVTVLSTILPLIRLSKIDVLETLKKG